MNYMKTEGCIKPLESKGRVQKWLKRMAGYWQIYILLLPGLLYFMVFKIGPMWGLQFAFYDYNIFGGLAKSEFVGFRNFASFIKSDTFLLMLRNTMAISFINLIFYFPAPIILALLII